MPLLVALLLFSLLDARAHAECAETSALMHGPETYNGRIADGRLFGATLEIDDPYASVVRGRFFIAPDYRDIAVNGTITDHTVLRLNAVDDGRLVFEGVFLDSYLERKNLTCDVVSGRTGGVAAVLSLAHISLPSADVTPELSTINSAALAVHRALLLGQPNVVADYIRFPLKLQDVRDSEHPYVIQTRREFLRAYPHLIDSKFMAGIKSDVPHDLFRHDEAYGMASGRIWFDADDAKIDVMNIGW